MKIFQKIIKKINLRFYDINNDIKNKNIIRGILEIEPNERNNKITLFNLLHSKNIPFIVVTLDVSKLDKSKYSNS